MSMKKQWNIRCINIDILKEVFCLFKDINVWHTFCTVSIIPTIQLTKVRGDFRCVICGRSGIILRRLLFVDLAQTVVNDVTDVILGPTGISRELQNPTKLNFTY